MAFSHERGTPVDQQLPFEAKFGFNPLQPDCGVTGILTYPNSLLLRSRRYWDPVISSRRSDRVYAQARTQGLSAVATHVRVGGLQ